MSLEVHTIPVISTVHLTKEVAEALTEKGSANDWCCCAPWEFGYFIFLDDLESCSHPVPQCLIDIRDWRMKLEMTKKLDNSRWVRLDGAAETVEGLPTYDW